NFNFDSLQLNQAVTTNFLRKSESAGVKTGLTSVLGSSMLNEIRGQIATDNRDEIPNSRLAQVTITGFGNLGGDSGRPRAFDSTRYEVTDNITAIWGAHRVRFGLDYKRSDVPQQREDTTQSRSGFTPLP